MNRLATFAMNRGAIARLTHVPLSFSVFFTQTLFFLTRVMFESVRETRRRFPARNERRDRFPSPISPRRTAAGSTGVTTSATWVVYPRLLFDSSHRGGPQGLSDVSYASARVHACILRFPSRALTPNTLVFQWHFLRLPPRRLDREGRLRAVAKIYPRSRDSGNVKNLSRSVEPLKVILMYRI